ncbi:MAG TPA: toll/interleukin-1 receptor domain-containing protein [Acidimicrobiales bacterium]|nr:toll/interleukin-1 receptor domain-containing protein [Acidimicrobiales bacterium]
MLDWFSARRDVDPDVDRIAHLAEARNQLENADVDPTSGLRALLAVAVELLGPDVRQIEGVMSEFLTNRPGATLIVSDSVVADLRAAGLSGKAISRLSFEVAADSSSSEERSQEAVMALSVFVSYSHEGEEPGGPWMKQVRGFARLLADSGVPVEIDQFGPHMGRDWSIWGPAAVDRADVVLCLASPDYRVKWTRSTGSGAAVEARTIRVRHEDGKRVAFVVLPGRASSDIPDDMRGFNRFTVRSLDRQGIEDLLRELTNQPRFPPPAIGTVPSLPPEV